MRYFRFKVLACAIFIGLLLPECAAIAQATAASTAPSATASDLEREKLALEREKLALEVEKLKSENAATSVVPLERQKLSLEVQKLEQEKANSVRNLFAWTGLQNLVYDNASLFSAIFIGAWALYKYLSERTKGRLDSEEERFEKTARGLGSEHDQERISSAVLLPIFLQQKYQRFYTQVFNLAAGNLRSNVQNPPDIPEGLPSALQTIDMSQSLRRTLMSVFRDSYPKARDVIFKQHARDLKKGTVNHIRLVRSSLNAAHVCLNNAFLDSADLNYAWLREASLHCATLKGARLEHAVLEGADLSYAILNTADLKNANLKRVNFTGASLLRSDFSAARVDEANFHSAKLTGATFKKCTALGTTFTNADLTEAVFDDIEFGSERPANLDHASSLKGAVLRNFRGLTAEQVERCRKLGANVEEDSARPKEIA